MSFIGEDLRRSILKEAIADRAMALHYGEEAGMPLVTAKLRLKEACRDLEDFERECKERRERWLLEHSFEDTDPHDYYRQYDAGRCTHCGKSESEHGGGDA